MIPASPGPSAKPTQSATRRTDLTALLVALRKSLVEETVYEDLEAVLGEYGSPTPDEVTTLTARLRAVLQQLIEIVPYRVAPYPVDEMRLAVRLGGEQPPPQGAHGHLRRFALAILAVLDLMEDAPR